MEYGLSKTKLYNILSGTKQLDELDCQPGDFMEYISENQKQ